LRLTNTISPRAALCTQKEPEGMMLTTLKESIAVPGKMICLLHPWHDPVPFRRAWCLFELYIAMTLKAQVIMVSRIGRGSLCGC
jgi:hypothetical protein